MAQALANVFISLPPVVRSHFDDQKGQLMDKLQGMTFKIAFSSEVVRRGPGTIRVILKSASFNDFNE